LNITEFRIGHYTDNVNITGCTVLLCPDNNRASCYISGAAPGSRETALLSPQKKMPGVQAILLTGGSAFGLAAAQGVVQYLEEKRIGYHTPFGVVPIVPAAVIFDLNIGNPDIRPVAENAYEACRSASAGNMEMRGSIGAGTGATVGKWSGIMNAMKGGLGIAKISVGGAWVQAAAVTNPVGDIIDEGGRIIAGAWSKDTGFLAAGGPEARWRTSAAGMIQNTVLCIVMTNVKLDKMQTYLLAKRAHNGLARTIIPANTSYDGDAIFAISGGEVDFNPDIVNDMSAEAVRRAILDGVKSAEGLGGVRSLNTRDRSQ
jgi:L-aminopeptidase/D-esterase-like protein